MNLESFMIQRSAGISCRGTCLSLAVQGEYLDYKDFQNSSLLGHTGCPGLCNQEIIFLLKYLWIVPIYLRITSIWWIKTGNLFCQDCVSNSLLHMITVPGCKLWRVCENSAQMEKLSGNRTLMHIPFHYQNMKFHETWRNSQTPSMLSNLVELGQKLQVEKKDTAGGKEKCLSNW